VLKQPCALEPFGGLKQLKPGLHELLRWSEDGPQGLTLVSSVSNLSARLEEAIQLVGATTELAASAGIAEAGVSAKRATDGAQHELALKLQLWLEPLLLKPEDRSNLWLASGRRDQTGSQKQLLLAQRTAN